MTCFYYIITENSSDDMKREREEKKRYLLRKLSFRPTVNELKDRKVSVFVMDRLLTDFGVFRLLLSGKKCAKNS